MLLSHMLWQEVGVWRAAALLDVDQGHAALLAAGDSLERLRAGYFVGHRAQAQVEHRVAAMVAQRVFGIALGYEDLIDHDQLRHDPVLVTLAGKLLAVQPVKLLVV